jgi:hypothetical protein
MVMLGENQQVFWFGTSGTLNKQNLPILLDFSQYMPDLFGSQ